MLRTTTTTKTTTTVTRSILNKRNYAAATSPTSTFNERPQTDQLIQDIANYVHNKDITSPLALQTAKWCLLDTMGCGLAALKFPLAKKVMTPVMADQLTQISQGTKIPGTNWVMDPINGSFTFGTMIRWLDFNDCWLAAEWGHPSDNLGGILPVADYINRTQKGKVTPLTINDVLKCMIKAHEIQGILALDNSFNSHGLDHVLLVKLATASVVSKLLGLTQEQTTQCIAHSLVDGQSLRTYRHSPNTGSRKSWAAGDAVSRAVRLAFMVKQTDGQLGDIPSILSAPKWGFYDVLNGGEPFKFNQRNTFDSYVMENVLFKISFPAEFHAQTAVEAALTVKQQLDAIGKTYANIKSIRIRTQQAGMDIINKSGPLYNYADRDHCIQYMVAIPLIYGELNANHYMDDIALGNPEIDVLRDKMECVVDEQFTKDYHDPEKRAIPNALLVELNDGTVLDEVVVDYPIGHRLRREEGIPLLLQKFTNHLDQHFGKDTRAAKILETSLDEKFGNMPVDQYVDMYHG